MTLLLNNRVIVLFMLVTMVAFHSCVPPERKVNKSIDFDLSDQKIQQLLRYKDMRAGDSLLAGLSDPSPTYRMVAAQAFASIQDDRFLDTLTSLLTDPVAEVREAAAFAIGQTGSEKAEQALVDAFAREDTSGYFFRFNATILEAIGKCGNPKNLHSLSTISSYTPKDTVLLLGQVRGIYYYALRGIILSEGTVTMVNYAIEDKWPAEVRVIAANYLARAKNLQLQPFIPDLILTLRKDTHPHIRIPLITALGKSKDEAVQETFRELYDQASDYRLRGQIIRSLGDFSHAEVDDLIIKAIRDPHPHVQLLAAAHLLEHGTEAQALQYRQLANDTFFWPTKAMLYRATNRHIPYYYTITKNNLRFQIMRAYRNATSPYERGALVEALSEDTRNHPFLLELARDEDEHAYVRISAAEGLKYMLGLSDFRNVYGVGAGRIMESVYAFFREAALSGDAGLAAVAAGVFHEEKIGWSKRDWQFLKDGLDSLEMPKEIETYRLLQEAWAKRTGEEIVPFPAPAASPFAWDLLERLGDSATAVVTTDRGEFAIRLMTVQAPGSVDLFVRSARGGYYDGKAFHRVVPNFVVQGGCPRGDGYGNSEQLIRSEFAQLYYDDEGWVGLASAGKDTEGVQFFITHTPTPHLDGKYTIIGKVKSGMDAVHKLIQGDRIQNITIL